MLEEAVFVAAVRALPQWAQVLGEDLLWHLREAQIHDGVRLAEDSASRWTVVDAFTWEEELLPMDKNSSVPYAIKLHAQQGGTQLSGHASGQVVDVKFHRVAISLLHDDRSEQK